MVKVSEIGPGTPVGKMILQDFLNWKQTGFNPSAKNVGGKDHYNSCLQYKKVSASAFRSQAKKIAKIALEQMPAHAASNDDESNHSELGKDTVEQAGKSRKKGGEIERILPIDSVNRNPWMRFCNNEDVKEQSGSDDDNYSPDDDESLSDDSLEGFDEIKLGELQNSRSPFLTEYPSNDKLLAIFPLDGDVTDTDSNQFEFIDDNTAIRRWGKLPKERESCVALIGLGTEKPSKIGFTDVDLMLLDAEIKRRMKANNYERDGNDDIWEIRATLQLPFKCEPQFYSRDGTVLKTFRMRSNGRGFAWGYFWLLAWQPPKPQPAKRIGGKLVQIMSKEDSSVYTEKTYESKKKKSKTIKK